MDTPRPSPRTDRTRRLPRRAHRWLNLPESHLQPLFHFPLSEVGALGRPAPPPALAAPAAGAAEPAAPAAAAPPPIGDKGGAAPAAMEVEGDGAEGKTEDKPEDKAGGGGEPDPLAARRKRLEMGLRTSLSFRPGGAAKQRKVTVEEVQAELGRGFDSLVVGGSISPVLLVPRLMPLLQLSAPFAVFSPSPQPLFDLMETLIKEELAMGITLSETWQREYQVLPGRTHPMMQMSAASGYILHGLRVNKQGARPPPVPTAQQVRAAKEAAAAAAAANAAAAAPPASSAGANAVGAGAPAGSEPASEGAAGAEEPAAKRAKTD